MMITDEHLGQLGVRDDWVGDVLLAEGANDGRSSVSPWFDLKVGPRWSLWAQSPDDGWLGYPFAAAVYGDVMVWALGDILRYRGVSSTSNECARNFASDLACGGGRPEELDGHFALLAWSESEQRWHAWANRHGTLHMYYGVGDHGSALGTSFTAVASAVSAKVLDWAAITGFFANGFFPEDTTFFSAVRILEPASHYTFDRNGKLLFHQRYWDWAHIPNFDRGYDSTVDAFEAVFSDVMSDAAGTDPLAVPISGGLDSRCTVAELTEAEGAHRDLSRLWAFSYGYSTDSVEIRIARKVGASRQLPVHPFVVEPYLFSRLEGVTSAVEGFQDVTQCRQAHVMPEVGRHAARVMAAHWGDVWLDDMGLVGRDHAKQHSDLVDHVLGKVRKRGSAWLVDTVCTPHLEGAAPEELLRAQVDSGLARLAAIDDLDFRVKAWKTEHWSCRWTTASLRAYQLGAFPRLPFYDTRISDFFCTVPSEFVAGRRMQIDYLKRFAPDLARVMWQPLMANLYWAEHFHTWLLPMRAARKLDRAVRRTRIVERNWEVQFGGDQGRAGLHKWLLDPDLKLHDLIPMSSTMGLVERFLSHAPDAGVGYTVSMLLTFSAWLDRHA